MDVMACAVSGSFMPRWNRAAAACNGWNFSPDQHHALMLVLRLFAGPLIHRFTPLGLLALCSGIAAMGLFGMSQASGAALLAAATVYGIGKSFFWPTSLGFVAEQFPKGRQAACGFAAIRVIE
jgi:MFS family permease